ncbi:LacI family DNA-binding transcriptional regulator [Bradyrhizobium elkanii]|uniref:LacI family DNA-binding transcriptional regulator n=1 Tax=Bradyrhizobium elkanii TaxID=29448 RepID=UPI00351377A7
MCRGLRSQPPVIVMAEQQTAGRGSKLTIRDVATAAGVSTGTVSRVLNANAHRPSRHPPEGPARNR